MSNTNEVNFNELHKKSSNHKELLAEVKKAGCFYCLKEFNTSKITEWIDEGKTAVCPHCRIDSVLPITEEVNSDILKEMNEVWFSPIIEKTEKIKEAPNDKE